jgi:hypothetical protein
VHVRRLTLAFLCAVVGMLGLTDAAALAAAPETPETTSPAADITATTATLDGVLNPNGMGEPGTYEFLYEASATECEAGSTVPVPPGIALGLEKETVPPVQLTGLEPGTQYTFCLLARNTAEEVSVGPAVTFTTSTEAPKIDSEYATEVTASSATLGAEVNPGGEETTYHFEYGTTEAYDQSTPESSSIGSDGTDHPAPAQIQGLLPDTLYHYQIVASNSKSAPGGTPGHDHTFKTQVLAGGGAVLPDGRAWELVSPAEKLGAQAIPGDILIQASEDGSAISYPMTAPFSVNAPANARAAQVLSRRGPDGWSTTDIATPHNKATLVTPQQEYELFSSNLSKALVEPLGETPLSQEAAEESPYEAVPYLRNNETGTYTALATPGNVLPGAKLGPNEVGGRPYVLIATATPDLSKIVIASQGPLTSDPPIPGYEFDYYYEWTAGRLKLITALPAGSEIPLKMEIGFDADMKHAISDDGSRIFWNTEAPQHLYMTDMTDGTVVRLDQAQDGVEEPSNNASEFQGASSDGSLVFFSDEAQLTTTPGGGLYSYNVETGKLTLVTVAPQGQDEFSGLILGAAEDGSDVYLVDGAVLSTVANADGETATATGNNLYVLHREVNGATEAWTPTFIAGLSGGPRGGNNRSGTTGLNIGDENDWMPKADPNAYKMGTQTVEASPNGQYLAFMSERRLTGYDNRDANSGEPDEEVYLYDTEGARLLCASCNPTGARPSGWLESNSVLSDPAQAWEGRWVAATIPGMTEAREEFNDLYEPRYVTDSGRLFFDSHDALVPQDVNGVGDVYEYEPEGEGSCEDTSATFSEKFVGCVALISGGTGPDESAFADASVNGNDVFFVTTDGLAPQDMGDDYDMYDAHVCSAEAPCAPSVEAPPPCTTADACKAAVSPQPGLFGAPPSATFNGAGNLAPAPVMTMNTKTRPLTRAQKLTRTLKACKKRPKQKRPACEKQARKRYGPIHKTKNADRRGQS